MSELTSIATDQAPGAIGPYSQAIRAGDMVFCSGQIPIDPKTGEFVAGGIQEQTRRCLENLQNVLAEAGTGLDRAVRLTVYLKDMEDFPRMNEVYATFDLTESTWPGEDRVYELGDSGCLERFEGYVGATYEESVLMYFPMVPTEGSWDQRQDREVVCVTYHMELEKLEGSVRQTGM